MVAKEGAEKEAAEEVVGSPRAQFCCRDRLPSTGQPWVQKNIYFCFIDYAKAFDCVDHNKLWKILKEMGLPDDLFLPLEKPICRSGSNS